MRIKFDNNTKSHQNLAKCLKIHAIIVNYKSLKKIFTDINLTCLSKNNMSMSCIQNAINANPTLKN